MRRLAITLLLAIASVPPVLGRTPEQNVAKGFAVDKSYHLENLGSISTFNGNLGVTIPLGLRYPVSAALSYQLLLTYGGNVWEFEYTKKEGQMDPNPPHDKPPVWVEHATLGPVSGVNTRVLRNVNAGLGWNVTLGFIETGKSINGYISPDGARHEFWPTLNSSTPEVPGVFYTRDGSYLRKTTEAGLTQIEFPDGTRHRFEPATGRLKVMLDRFGNEVKIDYDPGSNCATDPADCAEDWTIDDGFRIHKVDLKRIAASGTGGEAYSFDVVKTITFSYGTSAAATYTFAYTPDGSSDVLLPVSRQLALRQDCQVARYVLAAVLHSVTLPDGSKYEITLDRGNAATETDPTKITFASADGTNDSGFTNQECAGSPAIDVHPSVSGHLLKIKRPTGATTEWTYQWYRFPNFTPSGSNCGPTDRTDCDFALSPRRAIGVMERKDYSRPPASTLLSRTTYAHSDPGDPTNTRRTIVTTYDGLASTSPSAVSSSELYHFVPHTKLDPQKPLYGLPYTDLTDIRPGTEASNPDSEGRFLSTKTFAGGKLLSYTYVQYESDPSSGLLFDDTPTTNRRVLSERTVHLDENGNITNEITRTYSDFDDRGHYRSVTTKSGRNSSPAIDRTVITNYNQADASTGELNAGSSNWVLNTYSSETVSENSPNRKSLKTLSLFDRSTGFLKRRRTLKTIVTDTPSTTPAVVPVHANDLVVEYGQTAGNVISEAYYGGDGQSLGLAALAGLTLSDPEFSMTHTYSAGALAASQYTGTGFKSVDRTIDSATGLPRSSRDPSGVETEYEYDWFGRLIFSSPAGSAATTYDFDTPAAGASTVTIEQRDGPEVDDAVLATAVVEYDDLGRVSRETRSMPNNVNSSRLTTYNGRGLVESVSEWGSTGLTTDYTYDGLGRVLTVAAPDDSVVSTAYTGTDTIARSISVATSETEEESVTTTETTDPLGRLANVVSPSGTSTTYGYDLGGRLSKVTMVVPDPDEPAPATVTQTRTFAYDGRGFLTAEEHPESGVTSYTYDARGHVLTRTDSRPATVTFTYDAAERLTKVAHQVTAQQSVTLKTFAYDRSATDKSMGKLSSSTRFNRGMPGGDIAVKETYYYDDGAGRLSSKETQIGSGPVFTDSYEYDMLGAATAITYPNCENCGHPVRTVTNTYEEGRLTAVPGYTLSGAAGDGITYYRNGLVDQVKHVSVGTARTVEKQTYVTSHGMPRPSSISFSGFCNGFDGTPFLADKPVNANTEANLTISVPGTSTYQWYEVSAAGASSPISGQTTSTLTAKFTATTKVWVRVGDATCTADSNVATITVNACTAPDATITITPAEVDRDRTATASVRDAGSTAQYVWQLDGGGSITSASTTTRTIGFRVDCTGTPVTLHVEVTTCDTSQNSKSVPIGDATGVTLSFDGPSVIKAGESTSIEAQLTGTAPWTIKWSNQTQTSQTSSPVVSRPFSPAVTTAYTLTVTDDCGTVTSSPLTVTVLPPPTGLVAEATSTTTVGLAWDYGGVPGPDSFKVRRTGGGTTSTITLAGSARSYADGGRVANTSYTYEVYAVKSGVNSAFSNTELATTVIFGADIGMGSRMAATDVETLRTAVNAVRARTGLQPAVLTDPGALLGLWVRAVHITELRAALDQARNLLGLSPVGYSNPSLTAGSSIRAADVNELRGGVK